MATHLEPKGDTRSSGVLSVVFKTPEMHIPLWYWFRIHKRVDAIDEHLPLLNIVVEHLRKAEGRVFLVVFKNARLLNTQPLEDSRLRP